jgi:hypothetical protein
MMAASNCTCNVGRAVHGTYVIAATKNGKCYCGKPKSGNVKLVWSKEAGERHIYIHPDFSATLNAA